MVLHKLKAAALSLLLLAVVATGAGWLIRPPALGDEPKERTPQLRLRASAKRGDSDLRPGRMTVTGRVLDPQGKPVPNAAVMVLVRSKFSDRPLLRPTVHQGTCDRSGRFRIELPRTTSAQHDALLVTALAPGYGIGWAELNADAERPTADIALRPEQVIRGRLFDLQGQPVRGVALWVFRSVPIVRDVDLSTADRPGPTSKSVPGTLCPPGPARRSATTRGDSPCAGWAGACRCPVTSDDPRYGDPAHRDPDRRTAPTARDTVSPPGDPGRARPGCEADRNHLAAGPDDHRTRDLCRHRPTRPPCDWSRPVCSGPRADGEGRFRVALPAVTGTESPASCPGPRTAHPI